MVTVAFLEPSNEDTKRELINSLSRMNRRIKVHPKLFARVQKRGAAVKFFKETPNSYLFVSDERLGQLPDWVLENKVPLLNSPSFYSSKVLCDFFRPGTIQKGYFTQVGENQIPFFGTATILDVLFGIGIGAGLTVLDSFEVQEGKRVKVPSQDWKRWKEVRTEVVHTICALPPITDREYRRTLDPHVVDLLETILTTFRERLPNLGVVRLALDPDGQITPMFVRAERGFKWLTSDICVKSFFGGDTAVMPTIGQPPF